MALHGLADMTLGVRDVDEVSEFYAQFGLSPAWIAQCARAHTISPWRC
jgi:hypothetical protein